MVTWFVRILILFNLLYLAITGESFHTGDTFDMALAMCAMPLFWTKRTDWPIYVFSTYIALMLFNVMHWGGTASLILGLYFFILAVRQWRAAWLMLPVFYFVPWRNLALEHKTRLIQWSKYLGYWWDNGQHWVGFGWGTFMFHGPTMPVNGVHYTWAHNDFVEVLFELGIIGFSGLIALLVYGLCISRKHWHINCAVWGFIVCMFFYSPLQVITGQLIALAIALEIRKVKHLE